MEGSMAVHLTMLFDLPETFWSVLTLVGHRKSCGETSALQVGYKVH